MKLLKTIILGIAVSLMLSSYGDKIHTPSEVIKKVCTAFMSFDLKDTHEYIAKEHHNDLNEVIEQLEKPEIQASLVFIKEAMQKMDFEIISETIAEDGNTAIVISKTTFMGDVSEDSWPLIKEDGKWKLDKPVDFM